MRIIHTSDWHLGQSLYGYDRTEEQRSMLEQICGFVREEKPDALIVSGDIYHTGQPSAAAQKMFTEAVMALHETCPEMTVVIIAGNHDSASRHEVSRTLWATQNVWTIGAVDPDNIDRHIVEVSDRGYVIAIPYLSNMPEGLCRRLLDSVAGRNASGLPVVVAAHITVAGCDFTGHSDVREISVGGIDSVSLAELGIGYDYVALGHIHKPQTVAGSGGRVRYCGSPLPVSFDESYPHSVSLVDMESHGSIPVVRELPVANPHPLVTVPSSGFRKWDDVKALLREFPADVSAYVRLNVEVEGSLPPDASVEARSILGEGRGRFCTINSCRPEVAAALDRSLTVSEFRKMAPLEVARRYAEDRGTPMTDEMVRLFTEAERAVHSEEI